MSALAIAVTAAAAFGASPAQAALTSCGGGFADPAGDAIRYTVPFAPQAGSEAPHYDITDVFFTTSADTVHVNLKVADMKAEPDDVWWPTWNVDLTAAGVPFTINARMIDGSMTYYYWADGANQGVETSGEVVEGPGGGVIIDLPTSAIEGYEPGMTFTEVSAFTLDGQVAGLTPHNDSDRAPDSGDTTAEAASCTAKPAAAPPAAEQVAQQASSGTSEAAPAAPASEAPASAPAPAPAAAARSAAPARKAASKKRACAKKKSKSKKRKAATCKTKKSKKARAKKRR